MESIRAVVVDPDTEKRLTIQNVDPPSPLSSEAVIRVKAVSLNLGEVRFSMNAEAGWRPGWDLAGVVERAAADGSGPPVGTRVVGFVPIRRVGGAGCRADSCLSNCTGWGVFCSSFHITGCRSHRTVFA